MFNPLEFISSLIKVGREVTSLSGDINDSFRREAQRIIDAFRAHDIPPNEVMRLLPDGVVGKDPSVFERASTLKAHLKTVSPWAAATLQLDPAWIKGRTKCPHTRVQSYKHFVALSEFFERKVAESSEMDRFVLYVFKRDNEPMDRSRGMFVAILEERFAEVDDECLSRYFHMTHRHTFDNFYAVLNLLQILALCHFHGINCWGHVMKDADLLALDDCEGFIPQLWKSRPTKGWYPMDPFWIGMTGDQQWNEGMRKELEDYLVRSGMTDVVEKLTSDRVRLARK